MKNLKTTLNERCSRCEVVYKKMNKLCRRYYWILPSDVFFGLSYLSVSLLNLNFNLGILEHCISSGKADESGLLEECSKLDGMLSELEDHLFDLKKEIIVALIIRLAVIASVVLCILLFVWSLVLSLTNGFVRFVFSRQKKKQTALLLNFPKCESNLCNIS